MTKRLLVVAPSWVGDLIMAQTLFKVIKQQDSSAVIDVLAPAWAQSVLGHMTEVRNSWVLPTTHGELQLKKRLAVAKTLRTFGYDQAIVLPNSFKSALIPVWARIQQRTGWCGEMRFGLLNDIRFLDKKKYPRMIQRFAALALAKTAILPSDLPWPQLSVDACSVQATAAKFGLLYHSMKKPILALCPGAEYGPAKRWPPTYYAEVAKQKIAKGWEVWLFGSERDQPIAQVIQAGIEQKACNFTGKTSLHEAIELLSLAHVVVSNDSGLMHIAAALAKPLVAIYGSSTPDFTPPLTQLKQILSLQLPCSPCFERVCPLLHLNCLNRLLPDRVLSAIDEIY